jgi:GH24 family phage-related lysozyme (muramidase)
MACYRIPGPIGLQSFGGCIKDGTWCLAQSPVPGPVGLRFLEDVFGPWAWPVCAKLRQELSAEGLTLLKSIEELHLTPYDDQTGKDITAWVKGATIGYGHLISKGEWPTYKNGILASDADALFQRDLEPFVTTVRDDIHVPLEQRQFDALVILAFNIGRSAFSGSSVRALINDPSAPSTYPSLEAAWKAWNKSQGKVMRGLENRRASEWRIYTEGVYERW